MGIRAVISTQTPLVRFRASMEDILIKYGESDCIDVESMDPEDYQKSPGGVTAMVGPMVASLMRSGEFSAVRWVSFNPSAPPCFRYGGIENHSVYMTSDKVPLYTNFKESLWNEIHGISRMRLNKEEYEAFASFNWLTAERLMQFLTEVDLYWVHDFQLMLVSNMIGPSAPVVYQWHIPFVPFLMQPLMARFILKNMETADSLIVSTRREMEGLTRLGYHGRAFQLYPWIDESQHVVSPGAVEEALAKYGLEGKEIILLVARMDPIKRQDIAIQAFGKVAKERRDLVLVLVGDGSFTSSGLGHSKGAAWRSKLLGMVRELGLEDRVKMLGFVDDKRLAALYEASRLVILPSQLEGFGITTLEAWIHGKPVIVSSGAGSSELVANGVNGFVFRANDVEDLAGRMMDALKMDGDSMGRNGRQIAMMNTMDKAMNRLKEIFRETIEASSPGSEQ